MCHVLDGWFRLSLLISRIPDQGQPCQTSKISYGWQGFAVKLLCSCFPSIIMSIPFSTLHLMTWWCKNYTALTTAWGVYGGKTEASKYFVDQAWRAWAGLSKAGYSDSDLVDFSTHSLYRSQVCPYHICLKPWPKLISRPSSFPIQVHRNPWERASS